MSIQFRLCLFLPALAYLRNILGTPAAVLSLMKASKAGNVQHLEQLIYYGADINLRNSGGNTPLHVCALNQQVTHSCSGSYWKR